MLKEGASLKAIGRRKMWIIRTYQWLLCYFLNSSMCLTLLKWTLFCKLSFVGIRNSNPKRPLLHCQTRWAVSCGWTCGGRKGELWCLWAAWCNATSHVKISGLSPKPYVTQVSWVYLEWPFSKCVPWNVHFARRLHGPIHLDTAHYVFLLGHSSGTVGNCLSGSWPSQWRKLLKWQLFRLERLRKWNLFLSGQTLRKSRLHAVTVEGNVHVYLVLCILKKKIPTYRNLNISCKKNRVFISLTMGFCSSETWLSSGSLK